MHSIRAPCNEKLHSFGKTIFDYPANALRLSARCLVILWANAYSVYDQ